MAKENKGSKLRKMLSEGCISENYTLNGYFFKVYPYFNIDKVKFSFVEKGKSGTGFDIYVDTDEFALLCIDIDERKFEARLAADNGPYPGAWKYITGENAARELAIGKSQKGGVVVQGRNKDEKKQAFVPIQYKELRKMALLYLVVSGLKPVTGYYAELRELFKKGVERMAKYHGTQVAEEAQRQSAAEPIAQPAVVTEKAMPSAQNNPNNTKSEMLNNSKDTSVAATSAAEEGKIIAFKTCKKMEPLRNGYRIMVQPVTEPDETKMKYLYIPTEKIQSEFKQTEFNRFKEMTDKGTVRISLLVKESPSYYMFLKMPTIAG